MPQVAISLTLTFASPPSIGAGGTSGTMADKAVMRNAKGDFTIPASQVKGKLRHACEQLLRAEGVQICQPPRADTMCPHAEGVEPYCLLCQVFGSAGQRSRLQFHDLVVVQEDLPEETLRPMVSINRRRRVAEDKRLFLIETAPNIRCVRFANPEAICGYLGETAHLHLLLAGWKLLYTWGGGASRGLGWTEGEAQASACWDGTETKLNMEEVKQLCQRCK